MQQKNQELAAADEEVEAERAACDSVVAGAAAANAAPATAAAGATDKGKGADAEGKGKTEEDLPPICAHCGTEKSATNPLSRCSRCRLVWYCKGRGCQRAGWKSHKTKCQSVAEQAATDPVEELLREHAPSEFKCPIR